MANDAKHNPVLGRLYVDNVLKPRRKLIEDAISRGMDRGELRADLDLEVAVDVVVAPFIYRKMLSHLAPHTHRHDDAAVVDAVLTGLSARAPVPGGQR
jgi:hypothetical protein